MPEAVTRPYVVNKPLSQTILNTLSRDSRSFEVIINKNRFIYY